MKYLEFTFTTQPANEVVQDVLASVLAEVGFDSFVHTNTLDQPSVGKGDNPEVPFLTEIADVDFFKAYIPEASYDEVALKEALDFFPLPDVKISYAYTQAEDKDWNEEWEKNYFQPLVVDERCVISGTFHKDVPQAEYNIKIDPRMSFGTGHHATTSLMIRRILDDDMQGKRVLDMGCGTSILAILAKMRGADHCVAIDVDEWCVENSLENIELNHVDKIEVLLGNASSLAEQAPFDLIIANINRNILLADLSSYVPCMKKGAHIYMSGFYVSDVESIQAEAERQGLRLVDVRQQDEWACIKFVK